MIRVNFASSNAKIALVKLLEVMEGLLEELKYEEKKKSQPVILWTDISGKTINIQSMATIEIATVAVYLSNHRYDSARRVIQVELERRRDELAIYNRQDLLVIKEYHTYPTTYMLRVYYPD